MDSSVKGFTTLCGALVLVIVFSLPQKVDAFPQRVGEVQVLDAQTHEKVESLYPFGEDYEGGIEIATGDVDGDGTQEVVVAQSGGEHARGLVRILNSDYEVQESFLAFPEGAVGAEVDIALGDIDGDRADEIVISQPSGPLHRIHIFNGYGKHDRSTAGSIEYGVPFGLTVGNVVTQQGEPYAKDEIIIGSGRGRSPYVIVMDAAGRHLTEQFNPFNKEDEYGLSLGVIPQQTGNDVLAVGFQNGGQTSVKLYTFDGKKEVVHAEFDAWTKEVVSGVEFAALDVDNNGTDELIVTPAGDQQAEVRFFNVQGQRVDAPPLYAYEEDFRGGVDAAAVQQETRKEDMLLLAPHVQRRRGDFTRGERFIEVDLTRQVTYLWENGYLRNSYLISSGLSNTPTPGGEYSILKKLETHVYDGRPEYFFPNTPWNLRFIPGGAGGNYYFHTAYWHNNFGTPQSHGCINMREEDAKFLFYWADLGTPVSVHY